MLLELTHKRLKVYEKSLDLLSECYVLTGLFPTDEKYNLVKQIRRAALSVLLNIAEGSSRITVPDRKRFFEIARGKNFIYHVNQLPSSDSILHLLISFYLLITSCPSDHI